MKRVTVAGQGKLGFPVAAFLADRGATVTGLDIDSRRVRQLNSGDVPDYEPQASEALRRLLNEGSYRATDDPVEAYPEAEVVIVLVPLLAHHGHADFASLDQAVSSIVEHIRAGALIIFETTLPVGTTRQRYASLLTRRRGVRVAHSPERVSSGRIWQDLDSYPKLVGGVDQPSTEAAVRFYSRYLSAEVMAMRSAEAAELAKLAETTYRDLNIAYANELARMADEWDLDVSEIIEAANSQPYSHIHRPGVGVGGHCIPHYPYLLQTSTSGSDLVSIGRRINEGMPKWIVDRLAKEIGPLYGKSVHLLGIAYRPGVKESTTSPVFPLYEALLEEGADVTVSDPLYEPDELKGLGLKPGDLFRSEIVVLVTDHLEYRSIDWTRSKVRLFVDGRNAYEPEEFHEDGIGYLGVGRDGARRLVEMTDKTL